MTTMHCETQAEPEGPDYFTEHFEHEQQFNDWPQEYYHMHNAVATTDQVNRWVEEYIIGALHFQVTHYRQKDYSS